MSKERACRLILLAFLVLAGCEKIDFDEESGGTENSSATTHIIPTTSGTGSQYSPLLPEQVINGNGLSNQNYWVIGYVVGSTYRTMSNAQFEAETTNKSNILLSSDSTCTSAERCIPVELSSTSVVEALSLYQNPDRFRQCVMVQGVFGRYFSRNGIRSTLSGYWLPGFDISGIKTTPTEWQELNVEY